MILNQAEDVGLPCHHQWFRGSSLLVDRNERILEQRRRRNCCVPDRPYSGNRLCRSRWWTLPATATGSDHSSQEFTPCWERRHSDAYLASSVGTGSSNRCVEQTKEHQGQPASLEGPSNPKPVTFSASPLRSLAGSPQDPIKPHLRGRCPGRLSLHGAPGRSCIAGSPDTVHFCCGRRRSSLLGAA